MLLVLQRKPQRSRMCHVLNEFSLAIIMELKDTFDPITISCEVYRIKNNGKLQKAHLKQKNTKAILVKKEDIPSILVHTLLKYLNLQVCVPKLHHPWSTRSSLRPSANMKNILRGSYWIQVDRSCMIFICQLWISTGGEEWSYGELYKPRQFQIYMFKQRQCKIYRARNFFSKFNVF